jgi:metallo-beta-lactamase family protein
MKVTLYGAAGNVTGSAYHVQSQSASVLVDFGMFQGEKKLEALNGKTPFNARKLDAVVLTHAHLDHTGRLPLLVKNGYAGPVYATQATMDIVELILLDAARIQEQDLERHNRKRQRMGQPLLTLIYTEEDVKKLLALLTPIEYNKYFEIASGCQIRVREAGHILGSVSVEMTLEEEGRRKVILFSGDIGPQNMAILKDPDPFISADLVFMESTYGDHDHRPLDETLKEGAEIIDKAIEQQGKVLVPSFAIGRTQQLLYYMAIAIENGALDEIPVYLDSPMAIEATKIYASHQELFDEETLELVRSGALKTDLARLHFSNTPQESKALNDIQGPCMIIAGAGMCNAGRILHHLRHNLWKPETTVMIVGYQGEGSLGRRLLDGARMVKIFGEEIMVKAHIASMGGLSAHAGQSDLLNWLGSVAPSRPRLVLSHGEDRGRLPLAELIRNRYRLEPLLPEYGNSISL